MSVLSNSDRPGLGHAASRDSKLVLFPKGSQSPCELDLQLTEENSVRGGNGFQVESDTFVIFKSQFS